MKRAGYGIGCDVLFAAPGSLSVVLIQIRGALKRERPVVTTRATGRAKTKAYTVELEVAAIQRNDAGSETMKTAMNHRRRCDTKRLNLWLRTVSISLFMFSFLLQRPG